MKKIRKKPNILLILLLAAVIFVGLTTLGIIIYWYATGWLDAATEIILGYFMKGTRSALVLYWVLILPVLVFIFLLYGLIRRKRADNIVSTWEESMQIAVEAERKDFAAKLAKKSARRFAVLNEGSSPAYSGEKVSSLGELCEKFVAYSASELNLYFDISDVREFIAGLGVGKLIILRGASGAGKTSLAFAFGEFIGNPSAIIPVQPMWKERADLLGYYNEFTRTYNETTLFRKLYEANSDDRIHITVLDEMNIARVEYYFAEFLSLMEIPNPEIRYLEVVPDKWDSDPDGIKDGKIKLPDNMFFLGTVNDDDSAYAISDKVFDRAIVLNLDGKVAKSDYPPQKKVSVSYTEFSEMASAAKAHKMSEENAARIQKTDEYLIQNFRVTFGNRIRKQIDEFVSMYVACGGSETKAVDAILSKKVLRKLEYKDLSEYERQLRELILFLDETFGKDVMKNCIAYITALSERSR